jgi:hypothetical protein
MDYRIQDQPHTGILNRDEAVRLADEIYRAQLDALAEMVNYGSNLVVRAYISSAKGTTEIVVIGVLFKHVIAMLDATEVLLRKGIAYAALLQARAAFEASLYIDWILSSDSQNKARHYLVANLRLERQWAKRGIIGTPENKNYEERFQTLGRNQAVISPDIESDAKKHLAEVNRLLEQEDFKSIDAAFERIASRRKNYEPNWYTPLGKTSIRQIAQEVGRVPEYEIYYTRGSDVTHSGLYKDHIKFMPGNARLKNIRHLSDAHDLLTDIMGIAVHTFQRIIETYRSGEETAFSKKYTEDWRDSFLSVKYVQYSG